MRRCSHCGDPLDALMRGDARFCSGRCRVAAHRQSVPAELAARDRWVRWSAQKVPLQANGKPASSTDPSTWTTYREAKHSSAGVGVGFVLNGDGIVCLDLDHCLVDGVPTPEVVKLLEQLNTYVEVSPSGDGLHVWGYGTVGRGRRLPWVEAYGTGRYLTVTGQRWSQTNRLADLNGVLATI